MKRIFLLLLFVCINVLAFSQNRSLHFKTGLTLEKKENPQPNRNVSENLSYIEISYNFERADVFDIKQDTSQFQLLKGRIQAANATSTSPKLSIKNSRGEEKSYFFLGRELSMF